MLRTKTRSVYILCFSFSLVIIGCDVQQSFQSSETLSSDISHSESSNFDEIEVQQADPGILYSFSYDQSTATYSSRKPAALKNAIHDYILNGYERVKTSITIDINGNITMATEWLDGNADLNMPLESFDRTSHIQPAHQNDPVIRSEMANGFIRYYSKSGKVAHEYAIEESTLKIDTGEFIRNLKNSRKNLDTDSRIERNMTSLRQNGTNFQQLNRRYAQLSRPLGSGDKRIDQKQILDLKLGRIVSSSDVRPDGKILRRELFHFIDSEAAPVLRNSISETFGDQNGQWKVNSREVVTRENIQIFVNKSVIGE